MPGHTELGFHRQDVFSRDAAGALVDPSPDGWLGNPADFRQSRLAACRSKCELKAGLFHDPDV